MNRLLLCLAFLLLTGCADEPEVVIEETMLLYFEPIGMGQSASLADTVATEVIVRDSLTWVAYQDSLRPLAAFKPVDFSQAMVVMVAREVESGGYSVEVEEVETANGEIQINYLLTVPSPDCITVMADASPFQAVLVRRAEGTPRFAHRTELYRCTFQ